MGIFGKLFGNNDNDEQPKEEKKIFYAPLNERMQEACLKAQETFKFFWRELYWEHRRIVRAHDLAIVKIPFEQQFEGKKEPIVEHMWINSIDFDGEKITGVLMNNPHQLTNVAEGDQVSKNLNNISDWMLAIQGKTYGGYTIQVLRSDMAAQEREQHDAAWGLDFGDYDDILSVYEQKEKPENLVEHPMSKNMAEKVREFLSANPTEITTIDDNGLNMLHRETIAGNKTTVAILLEMGADKDVKTKKGKTALEFAKDLHWEHIVPELE